MISDIRLSYGRITRLFCLVILFVLASAELYSQTVSFYKFNNSQGLSSSKVYKIIQDRNDYIWIGTGSGLDRFDGLNIEPISIDDGLWHGGVYSIYEDKQGTIWFGHLEGKLSYYDGMGFGKVDIDTLEITSDITGILELDDRLWITTYAEGAFSFLRNDSTGVLTDHRHYRGGEGLSDRAFSSYIDPDGILYCVTEVGIKRYLPEDDRFETYKPNGLSNHFSPITIFVDSRGDKWIGTNKGGLIRINKGSEDPILYDIKNGLANNEVVCITEDSKGRIWTGTWGGGISVFDGDRVINFTRKNGLEADNIRQIVEDEEGNMLIATHTNGLNIFKGDYFVTYNTDRFFSNKNITALNEDKFSRLWFGSEEGVTLYDPDPDLDVIWPYKSDNQNFGSKIVAIENDLDGNVWVASADEGIFKYRFNEDKFSHEEEINEILPHNPNISSMVVDHENNLWIGTARYLAVWSTAHNVGQTFSQSNGLAANHISSLFVDKSGNIWISSILPSGLTKFNPGTGKFEIIDLNVEIPITAFTQTEDEIIWFGTSSGVYAFENDSLTRRVSEADGLLSNDIQVLKSDAGYLYIGTNKGLNRYDITSGRMISYTGMNGFAGIEANKGAAIRSADGNLWFGTVNGVTRLNPNLIPETDKEPLTHIKQISINYEPAEIADNLKISFKKRSIEFYYYSICVTNPEAVRYKVMLEGADPDWGPETDQTRIPYPSLSPGKYVFKVKALNSNGVWNSEPETFSFTIKPPFYFSAPFIISVGLLLILAIYLYIRIRERNLILEKEILEEKVEERTAEVVEKSKVIEEKNRDITASIRYAERIQMAMLPPEDSFKDTFVLFLPKDIVSGDFYWMYDTGDLQFLAAVDCTGHGVPGAFMSIIGSNSLTKIVREYGITRPAAILDQLNLEVTKSLLQRGETVISDGMDLALISFDKKSKKVEYAGAYNPLVIVRNGKHITIKADRFPIGMATRGKKGFTNNEVDVEVGDMLYMFSDGYPDQFGGPLCKKFKTLNLKNEFLKISNLPIDAQKDHLMKVLEEWRGDQSQIDDILVIGTRIN